MLLLRDIYARINRKHMNLWKLIGYNQPVHRIPDSTLSFRLYGFEAKELVKADVRLNNLGLMSANDYYKEKSQGEFRIITLGGEQTASSVADRSWPDFLEIELSQRLPGRKISVLNFGWPDAGPEHYLEYWGKEASQYQADLVIVNFVETDFFRSLAGAELRYKGQQLVHGQEISYTINGGGAKHHVSVVKGASGPVSLLNPMVVAPRPYGFFLEKPFFQDTSLVKKLQETIVEQQIAGAWTMMRSFPIEYLKRGARNPERLLVSQIRDFDPPKQDPVDKDKLVQFGVRTFGLLSRNIPNVVLLHNFHYGELRQPFELTERMMAMDPQIVVHDMRKKIPHGTSDAEIRSWYLIPHMGEKWSLKGHAAYAKLLADFLVEQKRLPGMRETPSK